MGFGMAAGAIVGQNLGAGKYERALHGGYLLIGLSELVAIPIAIAFYAFPGELFHIFTNDAATIEAGVILMHLRFLALPHMAAGNCLTQAINGSGDTIHPMIFSIVALLIFRICMGYLLVGIYEELGVWIAISLSNLLFGLLDFIWFTSGRWRHINIKINT
jgi:Na+-driven multidrug efflux pump